MNRLNLDFSLDLRSDRLQYINQYLKAHPINFTEAELNTMSEYILWGKNTLNENNGPARLRTDGFELTSAYSPQNIDSLDELLETPTFSEAQIRNSSNPPTKIPKPNFSRAKARTHATPTVLSDLELLWKDLDTIELKLRLYELEHNLKSTPISETLLSKFTPIEFTAIKHSAQLIKPYTYLKLKKQFKEKRQEQYIYQDTYSPTLLSNSTQNFDLPQAPYIHTEPFITFNTSPLWKKIMRPDRMPEPQDFTHDELSSISKLLWTSTPKPSLYFNFGDAAHLYKFYELYDDLLDAADRNTSSESNINDIIYMEQTYRSLANLSDLLTDILNLKIQKQSNQVIADFINKKYSKTYQPNYISTLYCKKCLETIAATALYHREVVENLFFTENFKRCKDCGRVLLLDEHNFVRRARSNDGFSPRCKCCEKKKRQGDQI